MVITRARLIGFTLIEMMIVLAITGLLIGLATGAFAVFSRDFTEREADFRASSERLRRLDLVYSAVESTVPWVVKASDGGYGYYFLGRDEGLTLVTVSGIYSAGAPAVIRLFREPDGPGRFKLVYEEAPLREVVLGAAEQELPFAHRLVVLEDLSSIAFEYYGWESTAVLVAAESGGESFPRWWPEYDGLQRRLHPSELRIELEGASWFFPLPYRAGFAQE